MATNFVARDGDKLAYSAFIVCTGILQRIEIPQHADCCINIDDDFFSSGKNVVNFGSVTAEILLLICMGGWVHTAHMTKIRTFPTFPPVIDLCKTFRKYRGISRLHNKGF